VQGYLYNLGQVQRPAIGGLCYLGAAGETVANNKGILVGASYRWEQDPLAALHGYVVMLALLVAPPFYALW
jgi:hypothetical protein